MPLGAVDRHGGSSAGKGSCCAYTAWSGLLSEGFSSHLNARNKTRSVLATEEFVTLFLSANWTSRQPRGQRLPFVTLPHDGGSGPALSPLQDGNHLPSAKHMP